MTKKAALLLDAALQLPDDDKRALALQLIDSLDLPMEPEVKDAWSKEIRRRVTEIREGKVKMIPWEKARRIIEAIHTV